MKPKPTNIAAAIDMKKTCFLNAERYDLVFETLILAQKDNHLLVKNTIPSQHISRVIKSPTFYLQCDDQLLRSSQLKSDGVNIVFPIDEFSHIEETRGEVRHVFGSQDNVSASFTNPFDNETKITKKIIDLSTSGVSLRTDIRSQLFVPGVTLPDIITQINDRYSQPVAGQIVYVRNYISLQGHLQHQVGIRFAEPLHNQI